jgi:hypothetical protein
LTEPRIVGAEAAHGNGCGILGVFHREWDSKNLPCRARTPPRQRTSTRRGIVGDSLSLSKTEVKHVQNRRHVSTERVLRSDRDGNSPTSPTVNPERENRPKQTDPAARGER